MYGVAQVRTGRTGLASRASWGDART